MNIVIVGAGEIGTHLATKLAEQRHTIVVIESDEVTARDLENKLDVRVIVGNGASPEVQLEADVPGCDVFYALTSDDNINLVASTMAKNFHAQKTVCRLRLALESQNLIFNFNSNFNVDEVFSAERLTAAELSKYIRNPDSDTDRVVEEFAGGYIELIELMVPPNSSISGKALKETRFPPRVRICAIRRGGELLIPSADDHLEIQDIVTVVGPQQSISKVVKQFEPDRKKKRAKNVVIFGGGEYGFALAQSLAALGDDFRIRIFEADPERCEQLADRLSNVTVLNADATSLVELKEENVGEANFFVATTPKDEDNVMTCLQAHSEGADYCLTLFHRADYADTITRFKDQMGILAAVSPREATRSMLMRFVSDSFHLLRKLEGAELIEVTVAEGAEVCGKLVREVSWPEGSVLVGLWHGADVRVPSAEDRIEAGDNLYAMVMKRSTQRFLKLVS